MAAVESGVAVLVEARDIIQEFQGIIRRKALDELDAWIGKARSVSSPPSPMAYRRTRRLSPPQLSIGVQK